MSIIKNLRNKEGKLTIIGWFWLGSALGLYNGIFLTLLVQQWL